jgi:hypothetical protein
MLASGIIDLILAAIIFAGLPGTAAWAIGLLVGINMVFGGAALIAMALHAREIDGEELSCPSYRSRPRGRRSGKCRFIAGSVHGAFDRSVAQFTRHRISDMRQTLKSTLILFALAAIVFSSLLCVEPLEKRIALVIGNANYSAKPLATPANDAGLIAHTLQAAGFDVAVARDQSIQSPLRSRRRANI